MTFFENIYIIPLFYGLAILGAIRDGARGFERQAQAAKLFEEAYVRSPDHPGVLHYLIHAYDDPVHAEQGLEAARRYAKAAAAVPHAMHMPSHIFTRLGYWDESAAANERAWQASELDVKRAGEPGTLRDFHSLNYLQYAYLQLGRYQNARRTLDHRCSIRCLDRQEDSAGHSRAAIAPCSWTDHLCHSGPRRV